VGKYGAEFAIDIELGPAAGAFHFKGVCGIFCHALFYAHLRTLAQGRGVAILVYGRYLALRSLCRDCKSCPSAAEAALILIHVRKSELQDRP